MRLLTLRPILSPRARLGHSLLAGIVLAGCGGQSAQNAQTAQNASAPASSTGSAADSAARSSTGPAMTIAVIPKGLSHSYWKGMQQGAQDAASELGSSIVWNGPASEAEVGRQVQIVEDAITRKVDGILLAPVDRKALVNVINKAAAAKIPLILVDSDADTKQRASFVATDNFKGGVLAAQRMGKLLGGKGKVGMVPVQPNSQSTGDREDGFEQTIKKEFPGIKVVRSNYGYSDRGKSRQAAEDMLTANPDMAGAFGPNESSAVGELGAIKARNKIGAIKIIGFDTPPVLVEAVRKGELDSIVVQNPYKMGFDGVKLIADIKAGKKVAPRVDTGVVLISKDNMDTPENKKLLGQP